jgi:hypothetical protein
MVPRATTKGSELMADIGSRWIIEGVADVTWEDGGQACIAEINADDDGTDDGVFVRFHSWFAGMKHADHEIADLGGRRVRVEITVLD